MPSAHEILSGLTQIANAALALGVVWHVVFAVYLVAIARGHRPSKRTAGGLAIAPLVSVSALAWAFGNPFNGAVFALLAAALAVSTARAARERVTLARGVPAWLGGFMVAFALVYPHFLEGFSPLVYLVAAPLGLVPCPTLSLLLGLALLGLVPSGRTWPVLLIVAGGTYALIGTVRLGVMLDLGLLLGVIGLGITRMRARGTDTIARSA